MLESLSPEARRVLEGARDHALAHLHNYIGTEHVLFALIASEREAGPLARYGVTLEAAVGKAMQSAAWVTDADALRAVGISPEDVRARLLDDFHVSVHIAGLTSWSHPDSVEAALVPRVRTVMELAAAAAGDEEVGRRHILWALLEEDGGLGVRILERLGVPLGELQAELGTG